MTDLLRYFYISGPMTGLDGYNFPAFYEAEDIVKAEFEDSVQTVVVLNPARTDASNLIPSSVHLDIASDATHVDARACQLALGRWLVNHPEVFDLRDALKRDLSWIAKFCTDLVLLPGYENSKGSQVELALARALKINIWLLEHGVLRGFEEEYLAKPTGGPDDEVRVTSSTGGQKGEKAAQFQSIPPGPLQELARQYAAGAKKYGDHNFRKGYPWSLSFSALNRHLWQFWNGEDRDDETGEKHIIAVAWHALALASFMDEHPEFDDRYRGAHADADAG